LIIGLPALALMAKGLLDAGAEAMAPHKGQRLYGGIYKHIRHPQALGEMFLWTAAAFLLNSPFLALMSSIYYPSFLITMWMEEQDLGLRFRQKYVDYIQRTGFIFPKHKARV
jgi:protein-S-isoprenylcysteine O-methyltransferase Ste14